MITPELILEDFGEQLLTDLNKKLRDNGVTFLGGDSKLGAKMRFDISYQNGGVVFQLLMPDYAYYVNKGRRPGKVSEEGRKDLEEWGKRKGYIGEFQTRDLTRRKDRQAQSKRERLKALKKMPFNKAKVAFAFVVARTITKRGYKGNHFLDEIIEDGRVDILLQDLRQFSKDIITS